MEVNPRRGVESMQRNSQFQYVSYQQGHRTRNDDFQDLQSVPRKGLISRMIDAIINLTTEEVDASERPIGISQLTRTTFQANAQHRRISNYPSPAGSNSLYQGTRSTQDYRFSQLTEPRR